MGALVYSESGWLVSGCWRPKLRDGAGRRRRGSKVAKGVGGDAVAA